MTASMTTDPPPIAFIYDRVLTTGTLALPQRTQLCKSYAAARGWDFRGHWVDVGDDAAFWDVRPQFDDMLCAIGRTPTDLPRVCLIAGWLRLSHTHEGQAELVQRVLGTGAWIETTSGDRRVPDRCVGVAGRS